MQRRVLKRITLALALAPFSLALHAAPKCADVERFLAGKATGVECFHSDDLRATDPLSPPITPGDNTIKTFADGSPLPGLLDGLGSFQATTDPKVISNAPPPSSGPVPGIQVEGWFADDPTHQARFLLRFPDDWNGRLVVAGSSGTRSEFNGDWAWSDYVLPKGYAYASQNKGVLNLWFLSFASETQPAPMSCRVAPPGAGVRSGWWVHFYDVDAAKPFTQWTQYMLQTAELARSALKATYDKFPSRTYAVGTSNGGYQVRRAMEEAPNLFDGGVDWEGTYINPTENILIDLPVALRNFPAYRDSGYDPASAAYQAILDAGFPPDIVHGDPANGGASLWKNYYNEFWEVTACQWQQRFDPTFSTYAGDGPAGYDLLGRLSVPGVFSSLQAVTTTGKIKKPLVTVAGTMDALLPIKHQARAYEDAVNDSRKGNNDHRDAQYRLYEVQNGNHIESYVSTFPELVEIQPHAHKAFDLLVAHVEKRAPLPPSQCIPLDGTISTNPSEPGNCESLYVQP